MEKQNKEIKSEKTARAKKGAPTYYYAVGRRKEATAQVRLYPITKSKLVLGEKTFDSGQIWVNDRLVEEYFRGDIYKKAYLEPFRTTNNLNRFVTTILVRGGGLSGQLDAVIHGISRALEKIDKEKYRPILKKRGFLTRDSRSKQRRKAGYAQKARAKKQSPKR